MGPRKARFFGVQRPARVACALLYSHPETGVGKTNMVHTHKEASILSTAPGLEESRERGRDLDRSTVPPAGMLIGDCYRVVGTLGVGGMGVVLLARDERLDRQVAIKVVQGDMALHPDFRERFLREARVMASIRHENVVTVYAYGEHEGAPYFVMEYIPGDTVDYWLRSRLGAGLPLDQALAILEQACRGLEEIHRSGAIHGDIKPSNLLIGPAFRVAIADLGLSLPLSEMRDDGRVPVAGTPAYMAPERGFGQVKPELAQRVDIYSMGVLAFELLTGRLPFEGDNAMKLLHLHRTEPPPTPSSLRPDLPPAIDEVVLAALEKDPEKRVPTAGRLREMLRDAQQSVTRPNDRVRVLLAEDDEDFRKLSARWLKRAFPGGEIVEAQDGEKAMEELRKGRFSLAVLDLHMPGLNGIELTAAIRDVDQSHRLPILVVTGQGGAPDWQILSELGADGFLVKPVDSTALIMTARRMVEEAA